MGRNYSRKKKRNSSVCCNDDNYSKKLVKIFQLMFSPVWYQLCSLNPCLQEQSFNVSSSVSDWVAQCSTDFSSNCPRGSIPVSTNAFLISNDCNPGRKNAEKILEHLMVWNVIFMSALQVLEEYSDLNNSPSWQMIRSQKMSVPWTFDCLFIPLLINEKSSDENVKNLRILMILIEPKNKQIRLLDSAEKLKILTGIWLATLYRKHWQIFKVNLGRSFSWQRYRARTQNSRRKMVLLNTKKNLHHPVFCAFTK